ncbi:phospholipase D-like domain-containing protein [Streptomyces sp. CC228A]|uniref:phospholipase D-like domain-containing protein n=1 Tax=Streptomyces sp. CC228A TaxID=2898186 RepID=UPI001F2E75EC|nr:phospholipase D-like domain-containing protein [Streptomyces sp. CC228A]
MLSGIRRRFTTAGVALLMAAGVLGPAGGGQTAAAAQTTGTAVAAGAAEAAAPPMGTLFNNPTSSDPAQQNAIRNQVRALIAAADTGSTIRMALYHFWDNTIAQDLASAHTARGVNVRVVLDSTTLDHPSAYNTLKSALGTDTRLGSYVMLCRTGTSCLGSTGKGINHNKFLLFSSLGGGAARQVVFQTTSNLTPSNYSRFWNSAVSVAGNTELYTAYTSYFGELAQQDRANWKYTYANAGAYKVYFFPRAGSTTGTDTVVNALDNVRCTWSDANGTHRTAIRVAMLKITRQAVADKLRSLAAAGCTVDIVYSETDTGTWNALHGQPRLTTRCYQHDDDANPATPNRIVHSKNMMIDGMYAGARHKLVFTGSHNWSGPALRDNDEAMLRITTPSVYDAFTANFTRVRAAALPGVSDNVAACR